MEETPSKNSDDLIRAAVSGDLADVSSFLSNTLDSWGKVQLISSIGTHDGIAMTTLNAAIRYNHLEVLRELLKGINQEHREFLFSAVTNKIMPFQLAAEYCSSSEMIITMQATLESAQMMRLMCLKTEEMRTPVHIAAQRSDSLDVMKAFLEWSHRPQRMTLLSMKDKDEWTPVHIAARHGEDAMRAMLDTLDIDHRMTLLSLKNTNGSTPIHIAAQHSADAMKAMFETLDMELRMTLLCVKNKNEWTPVHIAAQHSADAMKAMLDALDMENRMTLLSIKDNDEWTPIHIAAQDSADAMKAMLHMLDMEHRMTLLSMKQKDEWTPIHIAARHSADAMKAMLDALDMEHRMTLLDKKNKNGSTPIHIAAQHSADAMKAMLDALDMDHRMTLLSMKEKDEWTPIHIAAHYSADVMKAMLHMLDMENRMTLLLIKQKDEFTPVHIAAQHSADAMKAMLDALDMENRMTLLSMKEKKEWTPVHIAAHYSADVMKAMLHMLDMEHRMTLLRMKEKDEWTPIHIAAQHSADAMKAMLDALDMENRMTLLSMKEKDEWTPVHIAAHYSADVMKAMLHMLDMEHRMTLLRMKEKDEWTPVHIAAQHSADAMKAMLDALDMEHRMTLLDKKNKNGSTPIHIAAQHSADAMKAMFETLDMENRMTLLLIKQKDEFTPVHIAAHYSADAMKAMLDALDMENRMTLLSMKEKDEWTPVHIAAHYSADVMKAMLHMLDMEHRMTLLRMKEKDEWTPVHIAAQHSADAMKAMLDALDMEHRMTLLDKKNKNGSTPIHIAAQHSADAMKAMLDALDMDHRMTLLDKKNKNGSTPIHIAAQHSADAMKAMFETLDMENRMTLLLIKQKDEFTPVHIAAQHSADAMKAMLDALDMENRMTLLSMKEKKEWTPVHIAAHYSADVMKAMLHMLDMEHRMTLLRMKNKNECTPVHTASRHNAGAAMSMLEGLNQEQISSFLLDKELNGHTPVHLLVKNSHNTDSVAAMLGQLATEKKFLLLSETDITGKNAVNSLCLVKAFENEDLIAKIRLLNLNYESGVNVLHGLVAEKNLFAASSFLSWPSKSIDMIFVILLLVAVKTGNVAADCDMIYCLQVHDTALQLNSPCMAHLFHYMTTASHAALSAVLEHLATNQLIERKHHILLWKDRQNNNFLHLAASVNHCQFICKILYTQDTHQIRMALQDQNIDGLTPYNVTTGPETRSLLAWSESQHECYPLVAPPRVVVFYTSQNRPGAGAELDSIVSVLARLNIKPEKVTENPTRGDIYDIIRDNQTGEVSALIVVVMSHGDKGTVTLKDGQLPVNEILMHMKTPILEGIPKILILQACQCLLPSDCRTADLVNMEPGSRVTRNLFNISNILNESVDIDGFNASLDTIEDQDVSLALELTAPRSVTILPHESTPSTSSAARSPVCTEQIPSTSTADNTPRQNNDENENQTPVNNTNRSSDKQSTRKRLKDETSWSVNIRKKKRQHGEEYSDRKGNVHAAKTTVVATTKDCSGRCRFKCAIFISPEDRISINTQFWAVGRERQQEFFARSTSQSSNGSARKRITYKLDLDGTSLRVCKEFYLTTLNISQQRINHYHKTKDPVTGIPTPYKTGNNNPKTADEVLQQVRDHIDSYPRIESHYVRRDTKCEYVDSSLSIKNMYDSYCEQRVVQDERPVHLKMYTDIFCTEYNIRFQKPKKDLCDKCELNKKQPQDRTEEETIEYQRHIGSKIRTREERAADKLICDIETLVIDYDLENVFSLPKAEVSSLFYKSKLNVYNLTAIVQQTKRPYSAIWNETMSGRAGNDIASAVVSLLEMVLADYPQTKNLIMWSDSCVPQNRNSCMSYALQHFLQQHPSLKSITQKFCEPGHSSIQDIDSFHSTIERFVNGKSIWSPVSLVRYLKLVRESAGHKVKQLHKRDFLNYQNPAKLGRYNLVRYTGTKSLCYESERLCKVGVKLSFDDPEYVYHRVIQNSETRQNDLDNFILSNPKQQHRLHKLNDKKITDIRSMLPHMPEVDRSYMLSVIN